MLLLLNPATTAAVQMKLKGHNALNKLMQLVADLLHHTCVTRPTSGFDAGHQAYTHSMSSWLVRFYVDCSKIAANHRRWVLRA